MRARMGGIVCLGLAAVVTVSAFAHRGAAQDAGAPEAQASVPAPLPAQPAASPTRLADLRMRVGAVPLWQRGMSFFGLFGLVGIAWIFSSSRRRIPWRVILWGIALQLIFAVVVLKTSFGEAFFRWLNKGVVALLAFTNKGTEFIFGEYAKGPFTFALHVLPTIIFFSSLMTVLYHFGVMGRIVRAIAWAMQRTMKTSGAETLAAAGNIFLGQTEAPLMVKPFVPTLTRSELMAVMVGGFANVAGGVLAAYVGMLHDVFPDIAGHLIASSVMSAPASLVIAKVMLPEDGTPETAGTLDLKLEKIDANVIDAAARGASEGMSLAINVAAMLLAFLALLALVNYLLGTPALAVHHLFGWHWPTFTLEGLLGYAFWPISFLMGVSPADCAAVGTLLGEKTVLTEFIAYLRLGERLHAGLAIEYRSVVIATYALCGFANFGSIAIQIGGIGAMAPGRRHDLAKLGMRAMFGGMLSSCMTASVAGFLL